MNEQFRNEVLGAWRSRAAGVSSPPATESDLRTFEEAFGSIPAEFRWFLATCGGGPVGRQWVDNISELHATHFKFRSEFGPPRGWTLTDVFVIGWNGSGNPYGIHVPTGRILVEDRHHGGIRELASSFWAFLAEGLSISAVPDGAIGGENVPDDGASGLNRLHVHTDLVRKFPYRPSPNAMVACLVCFGLFTAIGSYAAISNDRGLIINGLITLNPTQATFFWWCVTGVCASFCFLAIALPAWWIYRNEEVELSDSSIQVPTSLFKRGVSTIFFDDLLSVSETVISRQRMLKIVHTGGHCTIPARMVTAKGYQAIRETLVNAIEARNQT